ncbi:DUF4256 domain-containing protein [Halomonas huangheensis]|uniref:DUF4256 domain-containing protein n=1 Tax=Halomonas huangheensis TaxID=1178482 RepID=W1ND96_9GAMM|nr:DUF4256 domain-containing protein [Halomonas huangheensis]ALM52950.1 hypothetical protein AR456_12135 [Halomonas huangheensis]ERL53125.1 hypothetical protein BJB45_17775 [Halomonas huangheensis]
MKPQQQKELLQTLQERFESNMNRHPDMSWEDVQSRLEGKTAKLKALYEMERTDGEPDVVGLDQKSGEYLFVDCSKESPTGRRSLCFDRAALEARKKHKPESSAADVAREIGIELLTEDQYRELQQFGPFDAKTSSWIQTPDNIRQRGGALFCDYRYGTVFTYHNGADSYYAARGFRGLLRV